MYKMMVPVLSMMHEPALLLQHYLDAAGTRQECRLPELTPITEGARPHFASAPKTRLLVLGALICSLAMPALAQTSVHLTQQDADGGSSSLTLQPTLDEMSVDGTVRAASLANDAPIGTTNKMSLHGNIEVTPAGAAKFTLPLFVPPNNGHVVPSLALVYNSQAGDGYFGRGWSLSGLSAISRCSRTPAQDAMNGYKAPGGIHWDATDAFCLDGQRLIPVQTTATSPPPGLLREFRTEVDSLSRITAYAGEYNRNILNPGYFVVEDANGLVRTYGNQIPNASSNFVARNGYTWQWAVGNVSDRSANQYNVIYNNTPSLQQFSPDHIALDLNNVNGTTSLETDISLTYQGRPDPSTMLEGGNDIGLNSVVSCITVAVNDLPNTTNRQGPYFRQYRLYYNSAQVPSGPQDSCVRSVAAPTDHALLTAIQQCAWNSSSSSTMICLPPVTFTYASSTQLTCNNQATSGDGLVNRWPCSSPVSSQATLPNGWQIVPGDFFGSGMDGILAISPTLPSWKLFKSTGSGFAIVSSGSLSNCGPTNGLRPRVFVGDFAGTGKDGFVITDDPATMNGTALGTQYAPPTSGYGLFQPTLDNNGNTNGFACAGGGASPSWTDFVVQGDFSGTGKTQLLTSPIPGLTYTYNVQGNNSYIATAPVTATYTGGAIFGLNASGTGLTQIAKGPGVTISPLTTQKCYVDGRNGTICSTIPFAEAQTQQLVTGNFLGDGATSFLTHLIQWHGRDSLAGVA